TACDNAHKVQPSTQSDVAGRTMVMGPLLIWCSSIPSAGDYSTATDFHGCETKPVAHTQTIYVEWYTPHAYTRDASGHGQYTELIEKQPGTTVYANGQAASLTNLTVYTNAALLSGGQQSILSAT